MQINGLNTETKLEQMRNARRIQILDVALELALEKGLMDITIVDIVNKAKLVELPFTNTINPFMKFYLIFKSES